jgi:hypothetical protein
MFLSRFGCSIFLATLEAGISVSDANPSTGMTFCSGILRTGEDEQSEELEREKKHAIGLDGFSNTEFRSRLDHFLKLLESLQDVIRRNIIHESPNPPNPGRAAL